MKTKYGHSFYKNRHENTLYSARTVLSIIIDALPEVNSAIDFGCGVGTWLSILKENGVGEIQGLDGPWVDQNLLEIPEQDFHRVNFEKRIDLDKKYDLAMSLEVAEHLSHETTSCFVDSLVNASNFILFSAAIPLQGGRGHINEQWPDYWADLFNARGFVCLDFVRRAIWNDDQILPWYRQNILVFVKKEQMQKVKIPGLDLCNNHSPISLVHPAIYVKNVSQTLSVRWILGSFRRAVKIWVKNKMSRNR